MNKPPALNSGDKVALVTPAGAVSPKQLALAKARVMALGLEVAYHAPQRQFGYFAGTLDERIVEFNHVINDASIKAVIAVRGGIGSAALLPHIDYAALKKQPKVIMGLSDITALLQAINMHSDLVTFHGPVASMQWPNYTVEYMQQLLFGAGEICLSNPDKMGDDVVATDYLIQTMFPGTAQGYLRGGNLSTLVSLLGTSYLQQDWQNVILFLEDTNEEVYRIERMLLQLELAGILPQLAGMVFGQFTHCHCRTRGHFYLTDVIKRFAESLSIPTFFGGAFGHRPYQYILPIGIQAQMNADSGQIKLLTSATSFSS